MKPTINAQIYEEAARWFVDFRTGEMDMAERQRFNSWLHTSPEHVRAYLELAAIWNEGPRLDPNHSFDERKLAASASGANVIRYSRKGDDATDIPAGSTGHDARSARSAAPWYALAASLILALAIGSWFFLQRGVYATGIGEQRSISLADGSRVALNAQSRLRVRFTAEVRSIELIDGQALFQVAKDPDRPFIVKSDRTQVRAVGTQFDVYRKSSGTTVTVLEGRVAVLAPASSGEGSMELQVRRPADSPRGAQVRSPPIEAAAGEFLLDAGEQVRVTPQGTTKPEHANVSAATAWTQHTLIFESATLAEVADEFNRYNERQLVIESPDLHDFRITGTFSSTDPASLLRFLQSRPGIAITEDGDRIVVSRHPGHAH